MSLYQMVMAPWGKKVKIEELAQQIAQSQWVKVWEKLNDHVWQMSRSERKGYIRARGALLVQQAAEQTIRQRRLGQNTLANLYALAMDRVVGHVFEHMANCLPQAKTLRRAA